MTALRRDAPQVERRFVQARPELRAGGNGDAGIAVEGYAARFNTLSQPLEDWFGYRFVEQIAPGAFQKTLREADIRLLWNHDPNYVLARNRAGNLALGEDEQGLRMDATMTPTSYAQDLAANLRAGNVDQMSFAFRVIRDDWDETDEGTPRRTLLEVKLYDVSIVTYPAYEETEASLRALELDALLRATGLDRVPEEERGALLRDLMAREIAPSRLPLLRAAEEALRSLAATAAPAEGHAARPDAIRIRHQHNRRKVA